MKLSKMTLLVVGLSLAAGSTVMAQSWGWGGDEKGGEQQVKLLGTIAVPGKAISSTDIAWADQKTGKVVFSDRSNQAVEVIDGRHDLFLGRATTNGQATIASTTVASAAAGTVHFQGLPTTSPVSGVSASHFEGPNGVVTTDDKKAWAGDGDSTVKIVDIDPTSPTYLQIVAVVNTAMPGASGCVGGATSTSTCQRADELAYDPEDQIIAVANDEPESIQPYLTFISAVAPYPILGQFNFGAAPVNGQASGGLEQPVWDADIHRFLQTVPVTGSSTSTTGSVVVYKLQTSPFSVTIESVINLASSNCSPSGEALAPNGHLVVACATGGASGTLSTYPLVIDVKNGSVIGSMITGVGGGDEVNYNPGENEFVVSSSLDGVTAGPGNPLVLGVINANDGSLIQTAPAATAAPNSTTDGTGGLATTGRAGNLAALGSNSHVFVIVHPATSPATDICGAFTAGTTTTDYGCVAVFGPTGPGHRIDNDHDRNHQDNDGRSDDHDGR